MASKKNLSAGRKSPSRQRSIAMGLTTQHREKRVLRVARRLSRLEEKYTAGGAPRLKRRRANRQRKIKEVIATFKPRVTI